MKIVNTFIIPHYNYKGVIRCLETLHKHTPPNFKVILVDQGDEDLTEKIKDKVDLYLKSYRQLGFAKACNLGWQLADTKYVTICNDDVEFINKKWWDGVIESFNNEIIAVNPMSPRNYSMGLKITNNYPYLKDYSEEDYKKILDLPYKGFQCNAMFCTVFDNELAKKVGYFDEFFFPAGGEDTDWIIRAKGYRDSQNKFRGYDVISTPFS